MSQELAHRGEIVDGELVHAAGPVTLFQTEKPSEVVERATEVANALAKVVKKQKLTVGIQGRQHVRVEGWTLLGTMLGVFPVCVWTRKLENGWEARVEARTLAGALVGAAEAECLRAERTWASRDDYALRSMAQTRATSKALRQPLGFVMTLAGFDATPAEEMPFEPGDAGSRAGAVTSPSSAAPADDPASREQHAKLAVLIKELNEADPATEAQPEDGAQRARNWCKTQFGKTSRTQLSKTEMSALIEEVQRWLDNARLPFAG